MAAKRHLEGMVFERLTVLKDLGRRGHDTLYLCKCECGKETKVRGSQLTGGKTKSCGCFKIDKARRGKTPGEGGLHRAWWIYVNSSKKRGTEFNLSEQEFKEITSKDCFYCGGSPNTVASMNPNNKEDGYSDYTYNGIDRVDNSIGYTKKNMVPCCMWCNKMKLHRTQKEFLDHIAKIFNHFRR